jgi:hypothetical protein
MRQAHEEAAGMGLCDEFFVLNGIDPDAPYTPVAQREEATINGMIASGELVQKEQG